MTNGKNNHVHEDISPIQKIGNFPTIVILVGQVTSMPQRIDAGKDLQIKKESSPIGIWKLLREPKTLNPRKFNSSPLKMMVGRLIFSYWEGHFSGASC